MTRAGSVAPAANDVQQMAHDQLTVWRKLFASARGDGPGPARRLEILSVLLRMGGGWWQADRVCEHLNDTSKAARQEVGGVLRDLRRCGVLRWDEHAMAYGLVEELRVPLALMLVACAPQTIAADQMEMLDQLVPFAGLAGRHDGRQAPVWALLDLIDRDLGRLDVLLDDLEAGAERARDDALLDQAAGQLRRCSDELDRIRETGMADLVVPTVQRVSGMLERVGRMATRMSLVSRDHLRRRGTKLSHRQIRQAVLALSDEQLARAIVPAAGPRVAAVPGVGLLAALAALDTGSELVQRGFPTQEELFQAAPSAPTEPPQIDPAEQATQIISTAPPAEAIEQSADQFFSDRSWEDALRLQHGLLRLHARHLMAGTQIIHPQPGIVEISGGDVAWTSGLTLSGAQLRLSDQRRDTPSRDTGRELAA